MQYLRKDSLKSLQAGRALAAMAVLSFHLSLMMGDAGFSQVGRNLTRLGYLGVDFFFVLSGFIIAYAHSRDIGTPSALGRYLYRRFVRLYPVYWIFTAIVLVGLFVGGRHNHPPSGAAPWLTAITLLRFSADPTPIHPAWTLVHEIAFYLVFALIIAHRRLGGAVFLAWMLICLATYHYTSESDRTPFLTYTSAININFLFGMCAYAIFIRAWCPWFLLIIGGSIFVAAILADNLGHSAPPLLFAASLAAIIAALAILESRSAIWVPGWLALVGNASYVLYISHEFICVLILRLARKLALHVPDGVIYVVTFALATVIAVVIHLFLEKPLMNALRRKNWRTNERQESTN